MDTITVDLLSAVDFLLRQGRTVSGAFYCEPGSEIHLALTEAHTQARAALGIDQPEMPEETTQAA